MENKQKTIEEHLKQAFHHLTTAVNLSVDHVQEMESAKQRLAAMWEAFLVQFFNYVQDKGKEKKVNLLSFISLSKLGRMFLFK